MMYMDPLDLNTQDSPKPLLPTLIRSVSCVPLGILTLNDPSGCGAVTSPQRTRSNIDIDTLVYRSSPLRSYTSDGLRLTFRYRSPIGPPPNPAFHLPVILR